MAFLKKRISNSGNSRPLQEDEKSHGDAFNVDGMSAAEDVLEYARENDINCDPLDVIGLVKSLGIRLLLEPMSGDDSGQLERLSDNEWVMKVNSLHHPNRQRFTIAHELGHYIKHRKHTERFRDTVFFRNGESNKMEVEANQFASELLMPKDDFCRFVSGVSTEIKDIAEHFLVSAMAVRVRAKNLGYSGHGL